MKTKAMVLVIAKMNMKVHFNFLYENFVKMLVFIKVFGLMDVVSFHHVAIHQSRYLTQLLKWKGAIFRFVSRIVFRHNEKKMSGISHFISLSYYMCL